MIEIVSPIIPTEQNKKKVKKKEIRKKFKNNKIKLIPISFDLNLIASHPRVFRQKKLKLRASIILMICSQILILCIN